MEAMPAPLAARMEAMPPEAACFDDPFLDLFGDSLPSLLPPWDEEVDEFFLKRPM